VKKLSARAIVLCIIGTLTFIAYVFGYRYFTGNMPTNEIRLTQNWLWIAPFSVPHLFDILTAGIIFIIPIYFWHRKKAHPEDEDIFENLIASMIMGLLITILSAIIAFFGETSTSFPLLSLIITSVIFAIKGLYGATAEAYQIWNNDEDVGVAIYLKDILKQMVYYTPSMSLGIVLGTAILVLPIYGTIPVIALIVTGTVTFVIMTIIITAVATVSNIAIQWILGPKICTWFYNTRGTGGL